MSAQEQQIDFLQARIKALETALENERTNYLYLANSFTKRAEKITIITNPDFDKKLSEINKTYGN